MRAFFVLRRMRRLPIATNLDTVLSGHTPLVLAPHPDDESLGCGGLIAECSSQGRSPVIAVLTDGTGSHPNSRAYPPDRLRIVRERETLAAGAALGVTAERIAFLGERDSAAPSSGPRFEAVVSALGRICEQAGAGAILAPWEHDPHPDHEAAHLIARATADRLGLLHLSYPVWGWTLSGRKKLDGNTPLRGWRLDVSYHLPAKRLAIRAHGSQHGGLITDDPDGFSLPRGFLSLFDGPYETFLIPSSGSSGKSGSLLPAQH